MTQLTGVDLKLGLEDDRNASELTSPARYSSRSAPADVRELAGRVVLLGHYDPSMIAPLLSKENADRLATVSAPPGVPIHRLAEGLSRRGLRPFLLGGLQAHDPLAIDDEALSLATYRRRGTRAFSLTGWARERRAILAKLRQIRPLLVHAHWTMEGARAAADWKGPKILTVHDTAYEYARAGWRWHPGAIAYQARWLANTRAVLKRFDHVIAVSPYVETYLRLSHRFQGEIRVIPNGIPPLPETTAPARRFPKSGRLTFGCYGGPESLKNVTAAIRAFQQVRQSFPQSRLAIFGSGWTGHPLTRGDASLEFRGSLPHTAFLHCLSSEIDIWVHPVRLETQSITVCEALQAGCPVIAGRASGGVAWTLDYGAAGLLVDIEQPAAIAAAMLTLVQDRGRAMALVAYGQHMIARRFDPEAVLDLHLAYYQDVVRAWKEKGRP